MKKEIKIPAMGESISEATIGTILKQSGSQVTLDEEILELETDKVNQVLYAPKKGTLTLTVKTDDVVKIGQVIGYVEEGSIGAAEGESAKSAAQAPLQEVPQPKAPNPSTKDDAKPYSSSTEKMRYTKDDFLEELRQLTNETPPSSTRTPEKQEATPPKAAETATPTQQKSEQVLTQKTTPAPAQESRSTPQQQEGRETRKRMSKIRQVIANRLVEVQHSTAMLTTFNEVDMSAVMDLRKKYQDAFVKEHGVKLGFMSFFIKACVNALKEFPEINGYIDGTDIVYRNYFDISIAVSADRGLFVPVIRNCDHLSFADIESEILRLAERARNGSLTVDELQGGGFTITNGGIYGSLLSTPILNAPQSGILGMHAIQKRPVVVNDQIVIRPMMYLALSYDHRIVDGKEAVSFLVHLKNSLEDPARLLLEV